MNTKQDLKDCTFTIPFKCDSKMRLNNFVLVINYLLHHFDTNIIIYETGKKCILKYFWNKNWNKNCKLFFAKKEKSGFHKTMLLNKAAMEAKTDIIISHDADIILQPWQYIRARNAIKSKKYSFCYPFDNILIEVYPEHTKILRKEFVIEKSALFKKKHFKIEKPAKSALSPGGCLFMNKATFKEIGMENEQFIDYGYEDAERKQRIKTLGYKIKYISGYIYHLEHPHIRRKSGFERKNRKIFVAMRYNSKKEMQRYAKKLKQQWD